jgi:hypothetical protein
VVELLRKIKNLSAWNKGTYSVGCEIFLKTLSAYSLKSALFIYEPSDLNSAFNYLRTLGYKRFMYEASVEPISGKTRARLYPFYHEGEGLNVLKTAQEPIHFGSRSKICSACVSRVGKFWVWEGWWVLFFIAFVKNA